jgi:tetratricopeptide (TPR) repeat protein
MNHESNRRIYEHLGKQGVFNNMNNRLFIIVVLFFAALSGSSWAVENPAASIENPAVKDSAGTGRVPISSIQNGLVTLPNPIDTSSNQLVYGQVSGGKHFRGVLPYNVDTYFGGRLGSSSLDSFLRYSSGTGNIGVPAGRYESYYSPTRSVTGIRPGDSDVFRPPTPGGEFRSYALEGLAPVAVPGLEAKAGSETAYDNTGVDVSGLRPLAMTPEQIEKIISREMSNYMRAKESADEQYRIQMEQYRQKLEQLTRGTGESKQVPPAGQESLSGLYPEGKADQNVPQGGLQGGQPGQEIDVYEQMMQQVKGLQEQEGPQENKPTEQPGKAAGSREKPTDDKTFGGKKLSKLEISAAAEAILGKYESFAAYSQDKFNQYMRAAEIYLKDGKYYRAADAYTLATIYKPNDPLAYAGRSHALCAAGEYMSSALFLSRALEIFPEYARFKIDIVAMVGDKDKLESRIVDVKLWLERSGAGELQFLLAYVYYQMDRIDDAKDVIDSAYMKMPESVAVVALKKAIDDAVKSKTPVK